MESTVARVSLLDAPYQLDRLFDYYIPEELRAGIRVGSFVTVPFGGGNRRQSALVAEITEKSEFPELKPLSSVLSDAVCLDDEMLRLCAFLKEHTFCTLGDAVKTVLPASALTKLSETYRLSDSRNPDATLSPKELLVCRAVEGLRRTGYDKLVAQFGVSVRQTLGSLTAKGVLIHEVSVSEPKGKVRETVSLAFSPEEATEKISSGEFRGKKQIALVGLLSECEKLTMEDCRERLKISRSQILSLCERGLLKIEAADRFRSPYEGKVTRDYGENTLSSAQETAFSAIRTLLDTGEAKAALLHGVTGSGKTRVMKEVIDDVLSRGKSVIILVPEISLTPQTVDFFRFYYGDRIAVLHSMLSAGERFDAWRRIRTGDVSVCIGTRSAVFAPFRNLGAVIIDEEQEHTYKSDMNPKYHARDIARFRCAYHKALMLLASATPSVESYQKAKDGIYTLIPLAERFGEASLPAVRIVDLRQDAKEGRLSPIGSALQKELSARLVKKEQSILFINRRGYHHFLSCPLCGKVFTCPRCSVAMTYHTFRTPEPSRSGGTLFCHYCGYREPSPAVCPDCGNRALRFSGYGTQKVEEELHSLFPEAKILRMDADTTVGKFAYDSLLDTFRNGGADILLGTQMVTKGHDFPGVTLVGVLSADSSLYLDDYRANERTFDLITQVIGRAGRRETAGEALIQTYNPEHPLLNLAQSQNYAAFWENDIALRRALVFPPFCDIISVTLSSSAENELLHAAAAFDQRLRTLLTEAFSDVKIQIFGPMEAPVYKINDIFRMRMILKCRANSRTRLLVRQLLSEFSGQMGRKISFSADVNPNSV